MPITTVTKITGPVMVLISWMNASASHFAFFGGVRAQTSPNSDAGGDRDQHPEPQLGVEPAARAVRRRRRQPARSSCLLRRVPCGASPRRTSGVDPDPRFPAGEDAAARCRLLPAARRSRAPVRRPGAAHRARRAGLRRPAAGRRARRQGAAARARPRRAAADRLGQRAPRAHYLPLFSRLGPYDTDAARPRRPPRAAAAVRVLGPRGVAAAGRRCSRCCAGAWTRAARRGVGRHAAHPARPARARRAGAGGGARARAGRGERGARARAAEAHGAVVGLVATSSARSSGCSGAGRSPRRAGAASSGSTTCPSACCRARSLATPTPPVEDAQRELVRIAARALGVGAERDLRDYFRLPVAEARARVAELVEAGELWPVEVEGWRDAGLPATRRRALPRRGATRGRWSGRSTRWCGSARARSGCSASATGSRSTCPRPKRVHGYYVLPFLLGDRLVARVDLKADRAGGRAARAGGARGAGRAAGDGGGAGAPSSTRWRGGSGSAAWRCSRGATSPPRWPPQRERSLGEQDDEDDDGDDERDEAIVRVFMGPPWGWNPGRLVLRPGAGVPFPPGAPVQSWGS